MEFYDFTCKRIDGKEFSFSSLRGKIVLVLNSAIYDSLADQYVFLENLYRKYKNEDFEILDFPCDQFHGMCPGNDSEIETEIQNRYKTSFLRFQKCEVKGMGMHPLFAYLVNKKGFKGLDECHPLTKIIQANFIKSGHSLLEKNPEIRWNFTKFLIDRKGKVVRRFEATDSNSKIESGILRLIDRQPKIVQSGTEGIFVEKA